MNREDAIKKLKYGTINGIIAAYLSGAGVFYRSDVKLLLERIKELEVKVDNK